MAAWYYLWQSRPDDIALAERAALDALIVSETSVSPEDILPSYILDRFKGSSLHVTIGIEPGEANKYPTKEVAADRLRRIVEYAHGYPRWLRIEGRPVLVFWQLPSIQRSPDERPQDTWEWIRQQADPDHTTIWIAEGADVSPTTGTLTYLRGSAFDGLHLYSIAWADDPGTALASWAARLRSSGSDRLWAATVMPGGAWDDFRVTPTVRRDRPREGGEFYRQSWQGTIATNPDMIVITSWNEFPERTAIRGHPTDPTFGYGDFYLDLTRELVVVAKGSSN